MLGLKDKDINIKTEVLAGITTAFAIIPESVAFTFLLGIDPMIGLYTSCILGVMVSLFGGRPGMVSGAAGAIAVVFAALVAESGPEYLFSAVIMMGIIQVLIGVLNLSKYARIIPYAVTLGFVNGLAIVIGLAQIELFYYEESLIQGIELYVMIALVIIGMVIIYITPKIFKTIPGSLVAIIAITLLSLGINEFTSIHVYTIKDFLGGDIVSKLPPIYIPTFDVGMWVVVFPFALTAALVGLVESLLTLNLIDELTETEGQPRKETIAQGVGNIVVGVFSGMGGCAMIGQSMVNVSSGGKKNLSSFVVAISLLVFILFAGDLLEIIPLASLVAIMFTVVAKTFAWESIILRKHMCREERVIILTVTIITVFYNLGIAVLIGVIMSSLVFAWHKSETLYYNITETDDKIVYKFYGTLFFGSVYSFKKNVLLSRKLIIIDFENLKVTDYAAVECLLSLYLRCQTNDIKLEFINLNESSYMKIQRTAHTDLLNLVK